MAKRARKDVMVSLLPPPKTKAYGGKGRQGSSCGASGGAERPLAADRRCCREWCPLGYDASGSYCVPSASDNTRGANLCKGFECKGFEDASTVRPASCNAGRSARCLRRARWRRGSIKITLVGYYKLLQHDCARTA